ncbi:hypothetical protein like AT4G40080 [Hibiscus trionum]|uniref:ENTH domain-containing protein n=1 Tax=Hibiscus trionum TaxID=183268 RepID=A0A9W7I831_HIBTR|nr:hypothetical protein like AT4G40080 [Hibiscus trionum]
MGYRKNLRIILGNLKDKGSLIRTVLSTNPHKSSVRSAILRATSHGSSSLPSEHQMGAIISLGLESHAGACSCIQALMDRLNSTSDAFVALKCLYIIHNIIGKGLFVPNDQLSMYQCFGGRKFLNSWDQETRQMSDWVRWYAAILEQNLVVPKVLGYHLYNNKKDKILSSLNSDLLKEIDVLVEFACQVGNPPDSLHLQRNCLVYEVVRLVGEEYRLVQREIGSRVAELGARMTSLSRSECSEFLNSLNRFEDCKERISSLFVNRYRNADLWDLVKETRAKLVAMIKDKENVGTLTLVVKLQRGTSRVR